MDQLQRHHVVLRRRAGLGDLAEQNTRNIASRFADRAAQHREHWCPHSLIAQVLQIIIKGDERDVLPLNTALGLRTTR